MQVVVDGGGEPSPDSEAEAAGRAAADVATVFFVGLPFASNSSVWFIQPLLTLPDALAPARAPWPDPNGCCAAMGCCCAKGVATSSDDEPSGSNMSKGFAGWLRCRRAARRVAHAGRQQVA
jgi:hypothetical protein